MHRQRSTPSISLANQLKTFLREKIESARFESASEVIRHGLRTMQEQEERDRLYWTNLHKKVKEARTAIALGDVLDGSALIDL